LALSLKLAYIVSSHTAAHLAEPLDQMCDIPQRGILVVVS
jgi:hypothetical protein